MRNELCPIHEIAGSVERTGMLRDTVDDCERDVALSLEERERVSIHLMTAPKPFGEECGHGLRKPPSR